MKDIKSNRRTLLLLLVNFLIVFAVYQVFLQLEGSFGLAVTAVYLVIAALLAVAYFVVNRGFGKPISNPDDLPDTWSAKEKSAYIKDAARRHKQAKGILLWLLPFILTIMLDMMSLFILEPFLEMIQ